MIPEQWRFIDGYDGDYAVSNHGRVMSFKSSPEGKIRKPQEKWSGAEMLLCKDGKQRPVRVARLVAEAFLPLPQGGGRFVVVHKDNDCMNNHVENLCWRSSPKSHPIRRSDGKEFLSIQAAVRSHNATRQSIERALKYKGIEADGYRWEYIDP